MYLFFLRLQLEIYRSLGVEWLQDNSNSIIDNSIKKCRIRSASNNDVFTLNINHKNLNENENFNFINEIWSLCIK